MFLIKSITPYWLNALQIKKVESILKIQLFRVFISGISHEVIFKCEYYYLLLYHDIFLFI